MIPALQLSFNGFAGRRSAHDRTVRPPLGGCAQIAGFLTTPPDVSLVTCPALKTLPGCNNPPFCVVADQTSKGSTVRPVPLVTAVPCCVNTVNPPGTVTFVTVPDTDDVGMYDAPSTPD